MGEPVLELYCDGSGAERVGRQGGWAFVVVREGEVLAQASGSARRTTSLLMEFEAVIAALQAVEAHGWLASHRVEVITDCAIAVEVLEGRFLPRPPLARQEAHRLRAAAERCGAHGRWIRGHAGLKWNELVDELARAARRGAPATR